MNQKKPHNLKLTYSPDKLLNKGSRITQGKPESIDLPDYIQEKWDNIMNMLSKLSTAKVTLITQVHPEYIEINSANDNTAHAFYKGRKYPLLGKYFCEKVMQNKESLQIVNAGKNPEWQDSPDYLVSNIVSYYGEHVEWPDGKLFGTICYMDDQENDFSEDAKMLLTTCRESIEKDLIVFSQYLELNSVKNELKRLNEELEQKVSNRTRQLNALNDKLSTKNEELQKINFELDRFIYSASHGLKAPLTTMLGLVNLCKLEEDKEKHAEEYLHLMEKSLFNLQEIIQNISNYSQNARLALKFAPFNLYQLIVEILNDLRFMKHYQHVQLSLEVDPDFTMVSDAGRIKIILYHLISNAIKFHNPSIPNPYVLIRLAQKSPEIVIEVRDNGLGIATELQNKVFQLFYRANTASEGPGMGLYLVKETTELLGGEVALTSTLNEGSTFRLTLPKVPQ